MTIQLNQGQLYYGWKLEARRFTGPLLKFNDVSLHSAILAPSPHSEAVKMVTDLKFLSYFEGEQESSAKKCKQIYLYQGGKNERSQNFISCQWIAEEQLVTGCNEKY